MRLCELWTEAETWVVPPGWRQGRGAWGGLVVGQIITAASAGLPDPALAPRSLSAAMLAPVLAGEVGVEVEDLRVGKATLARQVQLRAVHGEILTQATVVFGTERVANPISAPRAASADPGPSPAEAVPLGPPVAPEFLASLRIAPVLGWPYSGAETPVTCGWIGTGEREPLTPAVVGALIDAWWPTGLAALDADAFQRGPLPMSTLDFTLTFPDPIAPGESLDPRGLWHVGRTLGGHGGYVTETRQLFAADGRLLAANTQLQAVGRSVDPAAPPIAEREAR